MCGFPMGQACFPLASAFGNSFHKASNNRYVDAFTVEQLLDVYKMLRFRFQEC